MFKSPDIPIKLLWEERINLQTTFFCTSTALIKDQTHKTTIYQFPRKQL